MPADISSPIVAIALAVTTACTSVPPPSSSAPQQSWILQGRYQLAASGYTGCLPDQNQISNVTVDHDGNGTWNAACKGKIYLCSVTREFGPAVISCAPAAP